MFNIECHPLSQIHTKVLEVISHCQGFQLEAPSEKECSLLKIIHEKVSFLNFICTHALFAYSVEEIGAFCSGACYPWARWYCNQYQVRCQFRILLNEAVNGLKCILWQCLSSKFIRGAMVQSADTSACLFLVKKMNIAACAGVIRTAKTFWYTEFIQATKDSVNQK